MRRKINIIVSESSVKAGILFFPMAGSLQKPKGAPEEDAFCGYELTEVPQRKDIIKICLELSSEDEEEERVQLTKRRVICDNMFCSDTKCGNSEVHGKSMLRKEIQKIINTADLQRISSKDIRLMVQKKLNICFEERKREFDKLVVKVFEERTDFVKAKKEKKIIDNKEKRMKYETAAKSYLKGNHNSVCECARVFGVDRRVLYTGIVKRNGEFPGSGKFTTVLSPEEEKKVYNHIVNISEIGFEPSWLTLSRSSRKS